ncbi:MAG: hypothetical protein ACUVXA_10740 [Candidatus Jordarchaeum sp.]|uniref:hypothetical protein n=1 Tax=Candidatus Jordarchaeum sp. TaxID=2823881 RepID=UPI00404B5453
MAKEGEVAALVSSIKNELRILGAVTARGLALLTADGGALYSDMAPDIKKRLNMFVPGFPAMSVGSNVTVNIDDRALIIMRVSEKTVLAVYTDQRVGVVLARMSTLINKFGKELDKVVGTSEK